MLHIQVIQILDHTIKVEMFGRLKRSNEQYLQSFKIRVIYPLFIELLR